MVFLRYYLWVAPHLLLAVLLVGILRKHLFKQNPIFSIFLMFELVQFIVGFSLSRLLPPTAMDPYRWVMAYGLVISTCLELAVISELAGNFLRSRASTENWLRPVLRGILAALVLGAAVSSALLPENNFRRVVSVFETVDFSSNFIEVGLVIALFIFARALNISWRSWGVGVALGLGVSASISLSGAAMRSALGTKGFIAADIVEMAAYHAQVIVWMVYLFLPAREPKFSRETISRSDLQFWDQELQRMVRR